MLVDFIDLEIFKVYHEATSDPKYWPVPLQVKYVEAD